jgi:hypothetical protein
MLRVRTKVVTAGIPNARAKAALKALCEELGKDMADQVRANMVRFGKPGGDGGWPPLSGYNQGGKAAHTRAAKAHTAASKRTEGEQRQSHRLEAAKHRKAAKDGVSRHAGYARQKEAGRTPGNGTFKATDLLRDTGALFASLAASVVERAGAIVISLIAEGTGTGRSITNQRLLEVHTLGEGNMPQRDSTQKMTNYEKRIERRVRDLMAKILGAK